MEKRSSRRSRPAKAPLTREGIIDAAVEILESEGLRKVTMRRVADQLDTGHASLYVYVRDTADLHAQVLDGQLAKIVLPQRAAGDWRGQLTSVLKSYLQVLREYPEISKMALSTRPSGPHYMALVETLLGLLITAGATPRAAAWGVDALLLYPTALAVEHPAGPSDPQNSEAQIENLQAADPKRFPHTAALAVELFSGSGVDRFDWVLNALIDGIISTHPEGTS